MIHLAQLLVLLCIKLFYSSELISQVCDVENLKLRSLLLLLMHALEPQAHSEHIKSSKHDKSAQRAPKIFREPKGNYRWYAYRYGCVIILFVLQHLQ